MRTTKALCVFLSLFACLESTSAQQCNDYFSTEWLQPLDMNGAGDILANISPLENHEISSISYANGIATFLATGNDPWFNILTQGVTGSLQDGTTRYGETKPIATSFYRYLSIRMNSDRVSDLQVYWSKGGTNFAITEPITTSVGWRTYTIDLANQKISDSSGSSAWTNGPAYGLRIDPVRNQPGATIQIDSIQLTNTRCDFGQAPALGFIQPDREGGDDYFTVVRGNPSNLDSASDINFEGGVSQAQLFPGNAYTDSGGATRTGDYLEATSKKDDGDPSHNLIFNDTALGIDPRRYSIACWTLDILQPTSVYHSVARVIWFHNDVPAVSDDIVNATTGESRYCVDMSTIPTEPALSTGAAHPWSLNSDGSFIKSFRIDPHEEPAATGYRFTDVRLATPHQADKAFTIVLDTDRGAATTLFRRRAGEGDTTIASLSAGRSSDVYVWDTSAVAEGSYQVGASINGVNFIAPGQVVVNHSGAVASDTAAPSLKLEAPLSGHRFDTSIEVAGYGIDNRRIAAIETFLNGQKIGTVLPSNFRIDVRNQFPSSPYNSSAGFQVQLDTSSFADGTYTFVARSYDTAGNQTEYETSVVKQRGASTPPVTYPVPNESPIDAPGAPVSPTKPPTATKPRPQLGVQVATASVTYRVTGAAQCSQVRIIANSAGPNANSVLSGGTQLGTLPGGTGTVVATSKKVTVRAPRVSSRARTMYILADCGAGTRASVKAVDIRKVIPRGKLPAVKTVIKKLKATFTAQ